MLYLTWVTGDEDLCSVILGTLLMEKKILERKFKDTKSEVRAKAEERNRENQ